MEIFGIDVSHYQGDINWSNVAASDKKFAIMKCQYEAQSHRKDEKFEANYKGAGDNGLARGVYIYIARQSMADPEKDARSLLNHLNKRSLEYGIWLDLEDDSLAQKGKAYIRELAFKYAKIFKDAGYYVGIYCNKYWYDTYIHDDLKLDFDFWIARFPKDDRGKYNSNSSSKPTGIAVAWQYSSKGRVDGIGTDVDLDVDFDGNINLSGEEMPTPISYPLPARTLKQGDRGEDVKWLQYELSKRNYPVGNIDGIFGPKTENATKQFQQDHFVDGICGPLTISAFL